MLTFEKYLEEEVFPRLAEGVLDDDMPDALDDFMGDLEEVIKYGEEYGKYVAKETALNIVDEISRKYN